MSCSSYVFVHKMHYFCKKSKTLDWEMDGETKTYLVDELYSTSVVERRHSVNSNNNNDDDKFVVVVVIIVVVVDALGKNITDSL